MIRHIAALALAGAALSAATISIQPPSKTVQTGQTFTIDVTVGNVTDLYAFQFDVAFNPALLSAVDVNEGPLFSSSGVSFFPGMIDNTAGTVSFVGDSLSGLGPGVDGPGTLATIQFNALAAGSGTVSLGNVVLLDSGLGDIAFATADGRVTVQASSVPEPSTATLIAGAATLIGILGRLCRCKLACHAG